MKEYKPINVLFFILLTLSFLLPVVYFAPKDGYRFFGISISFLSWKNLLNPPVQEKKNIDFLDDLNIGDIDDSDFETTESSDSSNLGMPSKKVVLAVKSQTKIHMNTESRNQLHVFFDALTSALTKKRKINICHYGDSQIEGDRMTAFMRQRLQTQFGGAGPGLIPALNVYSTISFRHEYSSNFKRKIIFGKEKLRSNKYGAMLSAAVFDVDSSKSIAGLPTEATIMIKPSRLAYSRCKAYNHLAIYYNSCETYCDVEVYNENVLIAKDSLISDGQAHVFKTKFPVTPSELNIVFKSTRSPVINGISLEGDVGVQMSNIAMRGSSGTSFGAVDFKSMSYMHQDLNTRLIILQFGGNSIPHFKDSAGVRNYAYLFQKQIKYLQSSAPDAAIIVIGPSDMAQYKEGIFSSYEFIPYCIQEMKRQSLKAGASYWDLYHAMGGANSMFAWVENKLAGKDYVHFTTKGASTASQLFYDALISAYKEWEKKEKMTKQK
jgi:lysophospholipase L1-like esterase